MDNLSVGNGVLERPLGKTKKGFRLGGGLRESECTKAKIRGYGLHRAA